jgi:hypothetical protein
VNYILFQSLKLTVFICESFLTERVQRDARDIRALCFDESQPRFVDADDHEVQRYSTLSFFGIESDQIWKYLILNFLWFDFFAFNSDDSGCQE